MIVIYVVSLNSIKALLSLAYGDSSNPYVFIHSGTSDAIVHPFRKFDQEAGSDMTFGVLEKRDNE